MQRMLINLITLNKLSTRLRTSARSAAAARWQARCSARWMAPERRRCSAVRVMAASVSAASASGMSAASASSTRRGSRCAPMELFLGFATVGG